MTSFEGLVYHVPDNIFDDDGSLYEHDVDVISGTAIAEEYVENFPYLDSYTLLLLYPEDIRKGINMELFEELVIKIRSIIPVNPLQMTISDIFNIHCFLIEFVISLNTNKVYTITDVEINSIYEKMFQYTKSDKLIADYETVMNFVEVLKKLGYYGDYRP